ncbi:hypothetical protein MHTCC0001_27540 [Flavobacteriaceae bacterium MHTCC 0001]
MIMKKYIFLIAAIILGGFTATAATTNLAENTITRFNRGYGNSFIFVENGIEFSVFPDGQFDFNILSCQPNLSISYNAPRANISFNTGYNYNAFVQYDEFGAIIQIENTPIFYDYYGRIAQAGNINIHYNSFGRISRVGGLYVHYNRFNRFSHYTGFINVYNRSYVHRPWHRFYSVPAIDYCVVYNRPYRRFYTPVRYTYNRPFYNNYRPRTAIASRRGNKIIRNRSYATINRSGRNRTKVNNIANSRRTYNNYRKADIKRKNSVNTRIANNRSYSKNVDRIRTQRVVPNTNRNNRSNRYNNNKTVTRQSTTVTRTSPKRNSNYQVTRKTHTTVVRKPNSNTTRTYNRSIVNRSAANKNAYRSSRSSKPAPKVTTRSSRTTNARATQSRGTSRNNNITSNTSRRRR